MLKCAILQQAATLATATSKTVTIPISVANEDPNFGVYAVPGLKSHVVVGPFKTKEAVNVADDDDNLEAPRFPDHNDKDRKPNGDGMVTSLRLETHMSCDSTDILSDNTDKATCPWCGDVRGNIINTHMETCGRDSHSRYRDDCLP